MDLADDILEGADAAAAYTGLQVRSIYYAVDTGRLPCVRLGRKMVFRKSELNRALSASEAQSAA